METNHKIIAIGSSSGGGYAAPSLVKKIKRNNCSIVLIPHVSDWEIKDSLLKENISLEDSNFIFDIRKEDFEKGKVYLNKYPSIDSSFKYLSKVFGKNLIGVVLSGAGNDGVQGLTHIKLNGGKIFAQSKPTLWNYVFNGYSNHYCKGMPEAAKEANNLDYFGSLNSLSKQINKNL